MVSWVPTPPPPTPIDGYLLGNERILASAKTAGVTFYASNKRLIRFEKSFITSVQDQITRRP
ncbi:MAG: hypothetical protein ACPLY9_01795 [Nitrososphaerales archaeon]